MTPISRPGVAADERVPLASEDVLSYWRGKLAGAPSLLELPTDRPRTAIQGDRRAVHRQAIPASLGQELEAFSLRAEASLFVTLLAGFSSVLQRYSRQDDLLVGAFLPGSVVLRNDLSGDPRFIDLVTRVREVTLEAQARQEIGFDTLVRELVPVANASHASLCQVSFILGDGSGLGARPQSLSATHRSDLVLFVERSTEGLVATFEYDSDLFDSERISRMAGHLLVLLQAAVSQPSLPLSSLPLLTPSERHQLFVEWAPPSPSFPRDLCVHQLFSLQASRSPDAIAVSFGSSSLTYRQLDERSNQLAWHLRSLGVGPEVLVGLCVERSVDLVLGMLAILKAGGAYLPLESSYPLERLAFMLQDSRVSALLVHSQFIERLPSFSGPILRLDSLPDSLASLPSSAPPASAVCPENLAYVIYTSGSTGRPKGSSILHRGIAALLFHCPPFSFSSSDVVAQASNASFDPSTFEIWGALLHGARLVGLTASPAHSPREFIAQLRDARVSVLFVTTAVLHLFAREAPDAFSSLRCLVFGGEAADPLALREVLSHGPPLQLLNGYGPTECSVFSTAHLVSSPPPLGFPVPIGPPLPNGPVFILDDHLNPVPLGVPGQLFISGERLGRGYFHRPELTALTYLPHPFSSAPGQRLYRTGDLARFLPDGSVEYLGRIDLQVKIRGYRVELGEVEEALRLHPSIKDVSVLARDFAGDRALVAYFVPRQSAPSSSELRSFLRERLPEHMVPSSFTPLSALPLTPNGKVDRRSLPAPAPARGDDSSFQPPRTPLEASLCRLWASLLGVPRVGIHDNFFHLGGHSLLATQLVSRIRSELGAILPLRSLFSSPTVAELAAQLSASLPGGSQEELAALSHLPHDGTAPLSLVQERLWLLEQFQSGVVAYNIPLSYRIHSPVDVSVLERSLAEIVRRHEVLRTTFGVSSDTKPFQRIQPPGPFVLPVVDLRHLAPSEREAEVSRLGHAERTKPFDLVAGPLLRGALLRLDENAYQLLLTVHHIVSDGWSLGVLLQEMRTLYGAFSADQPSPLPELPIQYVDFVRWEKQWLQSGAPERLLSYWRPQLAGAPELLELPTDRPRPATHRLKGTTSSFPIPAELFRAVEALSHREGATLFMTLLAGFVTLLHRYSGQTDIVVGTPIAHRTRPELESLIGFFINNLALRNDLSGDPRFVDLLARVREVTLGAYTHQDLPFEVLLDDLKPERNLGRAPVYQVMFVLQNAPTLAPDPSAALQLSATEEPWEMSTGSSKCDLILYVARAPEGLRGTFEYDSDLFDSERISRMAGHLLTLLQAAVSQPSLPLSSLPLLTPEERHQLFVEWAPPSPSFPRDLCVHQLFSLQASRTPDAIAVSFGSSSLTYRQLDERSNQLAWHLRSLGVGPEVLVGLCVERSVDLVLGMLAILKAGGAYLPLESSYPLERLAFMLQDSRVSALLVHSQFIERLPSFSGPVLRLDSLPDSLASLPSSAPPASAVCPENLAYVIYTSGSTGRPKGSSILHRGIAALLFHCPPFSFSSSDVVAQASNASFDPSTFEIWGALLHGARLVGLTASPAHSPREFIAQLRDARVSVLFVTTAVLHLFAREAPDAFSSLRCLVFGGEAADPLALREVLSHGPPLQLLNGYGPTECSVFSTAHLVSSPPPLGFPVPIGPPLPNGPVFILDDHLNPVPLGVPGQLFISGERLGRGYFHRPELTALTYLPHPFSSAPGQRLYRTGDLARFLPDGSVEYLGRIDLQVKIRGYRVELGEVEEALRLHPSIKDVSVLARDFAGDRALVAYFVPRQSAPSSSELRSFLRERLPEHMVPSSFTPLSSLPLTPNGKVDRRSLPAPAPARGDDSSFQPPRTPLEASLCRLWASLLGVPRVGIHDNFFHLGGHSLLATQLVSRIRSEFGAVLPLRSLFSSPTIAELVLHLGETPEAEPQRPMPPLVPVPRDRGLPLSFSQERLWRLAQTQPMSSAYNMPTALRLRGRVDAQAFQRTFQALVDRHEALRTTYGEEAGRPVQYVAPSLDVPLEQVDLRGLKDPETELKRLLHEGGEQSFDLARGPLLRVSLFWLADSEAVLLFNMHHINSDGWSSGVLFREMALLYASFATGQPLTLPPLAIQYPDFATWQRSWLSGEELEQRLGYWKQALAGAPVLLNLPIDRPRPSVRTFNAQTTLLSFGAERSAALRALCQREQVTTFMALLAVYGVFLARASRQEQVVIGSPIANRALPEMEPVIGLFINGIALRVDLRGGPSYREVLRRVRDDTLGAYAHQEVPFEQVVDALGVERLPNRTPLFQAMFALQNSPGSALELHGLSVETIEVLRAGAPYELTLALQETPEGIAGAVEFNTDLFDPSTGLRFQEELLSLLDDVIAEPEKPLVIPSA